MHCETFQIFNFSFHVLSFPALIIVHRPSIPIESKFLGQVDIALEYIGSILPMGFVLRVSIAFMSLTECRMGQAYIQAGTQITTSWQYLLHFLTYSTSFPSKRATRSTEYHFLILNCCGKSPIMLQGCDPTERIVYKAARNACTSQKKLRPQLFTSISSTIQCICSTFCLKVQDSRFKVQAQGSRSNKALIFDVFVLCASSRRDIVSLAVFHCVNIMLFSVPFCLPVPSSPIHVFVLNVVVVVAMVVSCMTVSIYPFCFFFTKFEERLEAVYRITYDR